MRSAWFKFALVIFSFAFDAAHAQINPHTQIRWPTGCGVGSGKVYNQTTNSCVDMNTIDPANQITWPSSCNAAGMVYDYVAHQCVKNINQIDPGTQLAWPGICNAAGMVYNFASNSCLNMNAIDPSRQVTWPPSCTAGTVYNPSNNSCVTTGTGNNPAGTNGQLQYNNGGFFGAVPGVTFDASGNFNFPGTVAASTSVVGTSIVGVAGAAVDGTTNDCTALTNAISALTAKGGGTLQLPHGNIYVGTACHLTISVPIRVTGTGKCSYYGDVCGSQITSGDGSGVLFTVTSNVAKFDNFGMVNTSAGTPTAGAAIFTNGTQAGQMVDYDGIFVNGFFDNVHVGVGAQWSMRASYLTNFVRYGLYVQNTVNADAGDWIASDNYIQAGTRTLATGSACINYESGGGGKIIGNKLLLNAESGIRMNATGSGQTLIIGNSIEQQLGAAINIVQGWFGITIANNYLVPANGFPGIALGGTGTSGTTIGGNIIHENGAGVNQYAITTTGTVTNVRILPNTYDGFLGSITCASGCSGDFDLTELPHRSMPNSNYLFDGIQTGTDAGKGFYLNKIGVADWLLGVGAYYQGGNWNAKNTNASSIETNVSGMTFRWDAGLTAGTTYAPTTRLTIGSSIATANSTLDNGAGNMTVGNNLVVTGSGTFGGSSTYNLDLSPPASDPAFRTNRKATTNNNVLYWATNAVQDWALGTFASNSDWVLQDRKNSNHAVLTIKTAAPANSLIVGTATLTYGNPLLPGTLYSAAGTALPTCGSTIKGATTIVSDATAPTYMGAYTSGGAITAEVICSYNGSTYSWLTH